jgi:hypothetical protein
VRRGFSMNSISPEYWITRFRGAFVGDDGLWCAALIQLEKDAA